MTLKQEINQFLYQHRFVEQFIKATIWTAVVLLIFILPVMVVVELDIHGYHKLEVVVSFIEACLGGGLLWSFFDWCT